MGRFVLETPHRARTTDEIFNSSDEILLTNARSPTKDLLMIILPTQPGPEKPLPPQPIQNPTKSDHKEISHLPTLSGLRRGQKKKEQASFSTDQVDAETPEEAETLEEAERLPTTPGLRRGQKKKEQARFFNRAKTQ